MIKNKKESTTKYNLGPFIDNSVRPIFLMAVICN